MCFEYDPAKSEANKAKHGIDFEEAQALWLDDNLIEVPTRAVDEVRYAAIGQIAGKHWVAIYTQRHGRIRLISVRRAREKEMRRYESS